MCAWPTDSWVCVLFWRTMLLLEVAAPPVPSSWLVMMGMRGHGKFRTVANDALFPSLPFLSIQISHSSVVRLCRTCRSSFFGGGELMNPFLVTTNDRVVRLTTGAPAAWDSKELTPKRNEQRPCRRAIGHRPGQRCHPWERSEKRFAWILPFSLLPNLQLWADSDNNRWRKGGGERA